MIGALCTFTLGILGVRSLALLFFERGRPAAIRALDLPFALFFLTASAAAFVFLGIQTKDRPMLLLLAIAIPVVLITLSLILRVRTPYRPRPYLFGIKVPAALLLVIATLLCVMVSGFRFLTEDEPLYKITMTGVSQQQAVEWKAPEGTLRRESLPAYEVRMETPEADLVADRFVYGDQVAVKARVLRLRPVLNSMGIRNLCHVEYIHNGYTTAQRHNEYPHKAQEIPTAHPWVIPFQSRFWTYWENTYLLRSSDPWVKSATLESTYFPLVNPDGTPFRGSFFLTLTPGGLSATPLP